MCHQQSSNGNQARLNRDRLHDHHMQGHSSPIKTTTMGNRKGEKDRDEERIPLDEQKQEQKDQEQHRTHRSERRRKGKNRGEQGGNERNNRNNTGGRLEEKEKPQREGEKHRR
ncbi:hypothetical protein NC652_011505 [Populus alba x Populus x berolinensis]|nr:hypothetical protein NC652_011505 [Populus alba x Populus x berolinensis]